MLDEYILIMVLLCSSVVTLPVQNVGEIVFPRLINSILFEENDQGSCKLGETCKKFKDCETALTDWKITRNIPKTCYFQGSDQFVCCRDDSSPRPVGILSKKRCDEAYPKPKKLELGLDVHAAVGGVDALLDEFPYMVALGWNDGKRISDFLCGGVLIYSNYVLTAAHCIAMEGQPPKFVRLGGRDLLSNTTEAFDIDIKIENTVVHPKYDPNIAYHDIAIVKLESNTYFKPACLWTLPTPPESKLVALGYGHKEFAGTNSNILQKVNITLFENEECELFYSGQSKTPEGITKNQMCAGDYTATRDTCQGDSGGPLLAIMNNGFQRIPQILGITSFGSACAGGIPGVYTRVSEYIEWIEQSTSS